MMYIMPSSKGSVKRRWPKILPASTLTTWEGTMGSGRWLHRAALGLAVVAGCAHSPFRATLSCPRHGGPPWSELLSPHFRLRTDLGEKDARTLLQKSEQIYAAFEDL